jgi:hypothetical protein
MNEALVIETLTLLCASALGIALALSMGLAPLIIQHNRVIAVRFLRLKASRPAIAPR